MSFNTKVTVVSGGTIWTGGPAPKLLHRADLIIEDGRVAAIEPQYSGRADVRLDATGCLVAPGLINAHAHGGTSPRSRGLAEDISQPKGVAYYHMTMPLQMHSPQVITPEELSVITEWDCTAMLLGGATTIVAEQFGAPDAWIQLVERLGFRCDLGITYPSTYAAIGYYKDGALQMGDPGDVSAGLRANLELYDRFHGAFDDRLRIHLSPHGPDTVPDDVLRETRLQANVRGIHIHLHLAQHVRECDVVFQRSGKTSVGYLDSMKFLGPDVLATHATYVDQADYDILARTGTSCVHVPYRKAKEAITSPFCEFLDHGINVALGTDSYSHDFILDMKLAAMLGKIRMGAAGRITAERVVSCATWGAAKALGRPDLGRLDPGARGDVIVVELTTPFNAPVFDSLRSLVYYSTGANVRSTTVDGIPVVERGRVLSSDFEVVRERTTEACKRLWQSASANGALPAGVTYSDPCGS